jgi:superfamily I DNA/RNA helicase
VGDRPDGLLLVGDNAQRIFTRGYSMRGIGIDIAGRSVVLRKNYRNTRQILEAAFPIVRSEWEAEERAVGFDPASIRPEYSVREGHRPIIVRCRDEEHEAAFIAAEVTALLKYRHYTPRAICVMARSNHYRDLALRALQRAHVPAFHYQRQATGEVSEDRDAVRISSLHGAKGHEYGAVFLVGAVSAVLPQPHPGDPEGAAAERALLYVAATRARDILYLSHSETRDGRRLTRSPLVDEMSTFCDKCEYRPHGNHPFVPSSALGSMP